MTRKTLWRVSVTVPAEAEEAALELLSGHLAAGASGYRAADASRATVSVYCPISPAPGALEALRQSLRQLEQSKLATRLDRIKVRRIRQENWAHSWKRHFRPLVVGRRLLVKPSWSRIRAGAGQHVVVLDPGLSFGTGHHPTTWFCLRQVVASRARNGAGSFLDLGTGSGILAIAAAKLGYGRIDAIDHDPDAIRVARENVRRNRVESMVHLRVQDLRRLPSRTTKLYDLVCANLTSDLIGEHRRRIAAQVSPGGTLVLAGILRHEFDSVAAAYTELGFHLAAQHGRAEWRSGRFVRGVSGDRSGDMGGPARR
jgi:ribosomal protein L11 methyltransferase